MIKRTIATSFQDIYIPQSIHYPTKHESIITKVFAFLLNSWNFNVFSGISDSVIVLPASNIEFNASKNLSLIVLLLLLYDKNSPVKHSFISVKDSSLESQIFSEELDVENVIKLRNYIFREVGNVEFSLEKYDSEFFEGLSEEQGTEGYFIIKEENLDELIKNEEAMKQLLDDDLSELESELLNIHGNAYNGAYQSEIYGLIWSELDIHFVGRVIDEQTKIGETTKWLQYVKIRDLQGNVEKFLSSRLGSEYNEDKLDYEGSYTTMMKRLMDDGEYDWLDFRIPDYPDYGLVTKDINDIFGDYI
jgi:hypothetical protein